MKLALVRRQYAATGGAELYLQRLLAALAGAGHEVHLFTEGWGELPREVRLHRLDPGGSRASRAWRFAVSVGFELEKARYDCVFSLERTLRQDVYRAGDGVHRVWLERRRDFAPWWRRPFLGWSRFHRSMLRLEAQVFDPRHTRRVIVNSDMVRREIRQHFGFPNDRIHLIRNGVDVERCQRGDRQATRARYGIHDDEFLLLFVGSGWERKGLRFLLRALEQFQLRQGHRRAASAAAEAGTSPRRFRLLVVGKGRRPLGAADYVTFAGSMPDVENAYAAADLFVFLPIYEPSANVCAEAMAAGLPVVTTAQNGAAELIQGGDNGTVVPSPAATEAVVAALDYWWSRRFYKAYADSGALSLERNVRETLAVLERAAAERNG